MHRTMASKVQWCRSAMTLEAFQSQWEREMVRPMMKQYTYVPGVRMLENIVKPLLHYAIKVCFSIL